MRYTEKDRHFFADSEESAAQWLLGKLLCCEVDGEIKKLCITETEAYPGTDSACYAYGKKPEEASEPTKPLFSQGGTCCIYAEMLLIACGDDKLPGNVLIRRAGDKDTYCDGPIKVCEALGIDKRFHGVDILGPNTTLWIEDNTEGIRYCSVERVGLGFVLNAEDKKAPRRFIAL